MKTWKVVLWNSVMLTIFLLGLLARDWILIGIGISMFLTFGISFMLKERS